MEEIKQLQDQLREYGFDDHKLDVLMALAFDEFMAQFTDDLEKLDIEDLDTLESELSSLTITDLMSGDNNQIENLLAKVYGLQSKNKVNNFLIEFLSDAVVQAQSAKEMLEKAANGDTTLLNGIDDDPNKQAIEEAVKIASEL
jgi:hypothetical protein